MWKFPLPEETRAAITANMANMIFMKNLNVTCKNAVAFYLLINIWKLYDQYRIIFHLELFVEKSFEHVGLDFRKIIGKCTKWLQNEDLGVPTPGIRTKFRSESNGDGPGPQNPLFGIENI